MGLPTLTGLMLLLKTYGLKHSTSSRVKVYNFILYIIGAELHELLHIVHPSERGSRCSIDPIKR